GVDRQRLRLDGAEPGDDQPRPDRTGPGEDGEGAAWLRPDAAARGEPGEARGDDRHAEVREDRQDGRREDPGEEVGVHVAAPAASVAEPAGGTAAGCRPPAAPPCSLAAAPGESAECAAASAGEAPSPSRGAGWGTPWRRRRPNSPSRIRPARPTLIAMSATL